MEKDNIITKKQLDYLLYLIPEFSFDSKNINERDYIKNNKPTEKLKKLTKKEATKIIAELSKIKDQYTRQVIKINDLVKDMTENEVYFNCKIIEKFLEVKNKLSCNKDDLINYWKEAGDIQYLPAYYYSFEGEETFINCTLLEYIYEYLEILTKGSLLWKEIYIYKKLGFEPNVWFSSESEIAKYKENKQLILDSLSENELYEFACNFDCNEFIEYFRENTAYRKDMCCGDALSSGVELQFKF